MSLPFEFTRLHAIAGAVVLGLIAVVGGILLYLTSPFSSVHASLQAANRDRLRVLDPVTVKFDQKVDLSHVKVTIQPAADFELKKQADRIVITPKPNWKPEQTYTIKLADVPNAKHNGNALKTWKATFTTARKVSVAGFLVDGKPAAPNQVVQPHSKFSIKFTVPMKPSTVVVQANGNSVPAAQLSWPAADTVDVATGPVVPYQGLSLSVPAGGQGSDGEVLLDPASISVTAQAVMPSNPNSGIGPDFKPVAPIMIVVENSGAARPQTGLQQADMVFEYVSEYQISRMTALYFNSPPNLVGPVRSCRMINPYLGFAFRGITMCSGGSVGTLHFVFGGTDSIPQLAATVNDFDSGNHFFRSGSRAAPSNLYTSGDRALRLRGEYGVPPPNYTIAPPHPDSTAGGQPAPPPGIGQHFVSYTYDDGAKQYMRFDHGTPFIDTSTGAQLSVKNVVIVHTPFHDAGWVEDENGGAHSVWYDLNGSGPAEIYTDGVLIPATWHMGAGNGQAYYLNHDPMWFSDASGNPVELNSGLTWIHVVGNGQ